MKAKKSSAKKVAKPVAAKKPVAKAKPVKKPVAAKKVVAKKPVAKAKAASPAKKPVVAKKPAAKPSKPAAKSSAGFSIKAAAAKLKSALTTKKPEPKPVKKAAVPVVAKKQPAPVPAKKPVAAPVVKAEVAKPAPVPTLKAVVRPEAAVPVKAKPKFVGKLPSNYVSPKGVLTEDQIRKSHDRDYMSDSQLEFFRHRLLQMRNEVLERELDVKERLHQREVFADPADRATAEEEHWLDLRLRERESLLLHKVDDALRRIADREYGYCEKTGDAIGIPRLLARPTATVCVDVKGQDERIESQFRDR
ncbi:RNA polymerase-binding protein DksA [Stenotrophobium rhamnosiphilum]|nr:RNA polymerase-binding protein DksA [Stenotrophobium rhamnosiphilum]